MKRIILLLAIFSAGAQLLKAQSNVTSGPLEKKLIDSLCLEMNKVDVASLKTKEQAENAFNEAFSKYSALLMNVAEERKIDVSDDGAMQALGTDIGKNLLKSNCASFLKIATKMAQKEKDPGAEIGTTQGTIKRIENKGFNYVVITDVAGKERSFLWLRQFDGSENFQSATSTYAGKKVKVKWQEMEVYVPAAKGYYKVKEITGIE
ncbi:hypothetical protein LLH06_16835 [Mucilaginibacter daejeonensis]|uniref:hypothetical protein n=1 Tax=Mucilaginibacter daejeonensis TaxID=398049 RepID=UPI001D16FEBF|nr:hypothetical protein [Mucilaginibacter daejeonensis]UEG52618.1 hypothetical protein LLH06_16835 [Mucilaginibacter daejeonensis]